MRALYLDSSVIVGWALGDPGVTKIIDRERKKWDELATSELSVVECQAGVSAQLAKDPDSLAIAEQALNQILARVLLLTADSLTLGSARHLVRRHRVTLGLRSLDAIHLASALGVRSAYEGEAKFRMDFLTADRRQYRAFTAEGFLGECVGM